LLEHQHKKRPIWHLDAYALSMHFWHPIKPAACQYWLSSALTDNKQKSGANQQASSYVIYRLVPILDTKALCVGYYLLTYL